MNKHVTVTENKSKGNEYWLPCLKCQAETVHVVFVSADSDGELPRADYAYYWNETHQVIRCQGCRTFSFRHESSNSEDYTQVSEEDWENEIRQEIYPPRYRQRPQLPDAGLLPNKVRAIYEETQFTLCNRQLILAGIGIRALVEAVCKDRNATGTLNNMIEQLVRSSDLKRIEADILHKLRFMGNVAAHEVKPHDEITLGHAFDIVEHLLINVYLLEIRAKQLD